MKATLLCYQGKLANGQEKPYVNVSVPPLSERKVSCEDSCGHWSESTFSDGARWERCDWNTWGPTCSSASGASAGPARTAAERVVRTWLASRPVPCGALLVGGAVAAMAFTACAAGSADDRPQPAGEAGRVVYLSFADGREGVTLGEDDDATRNVSRLCAAERFARWSGADGCADREACREAIRARVADYFGAYDLRVTTSRPNAGTPYTMVVVAPPHRECTFGRRGVAFADCGDANPSNVAFVFDCQTSVETCAVLVAHEVAHTFGLVHVSDAEDVMTSAPEEPALRFRADAADAIPNECGITNQSSHDVLLDVLGPRRK